MELMNNSKDLAPNIVTCLKAVAQLLNTPQTVSLLFRTNYTWIIQLFRQLSNNNVDFYLQGMHGYNFNDLNLPKVVENPYSGEQLQVFSAVSSHLSILRLDECQTQ